MVKKLKYEGTEMEIEVRDEDVVDYSGTGWIPEDAPDTPPVPKSDPQPTPQPQQVDEAKAEQPEAEHEADSESKGS